ARHASGRIVEVQIMHDTPGRPVIPGWRLIISDAGRFWFRTHVFSRVAVRAGAQSAVDADTFDEVQVAVAEQEKTARDAVAGV
ncbi:hypothetical protein ABT340_29710, partial [Streptosporangium sp. NPDC000239]|uniref:hypothetical protein n=1 Tax=Streptosporangium sp. NPDC000239 TaxID=3154248 RepID=UPI00332673A5